MLPLSVRIVWFILSLSGLFLCLVVSWAFGRTAGAMWLTISYSVGCTLLQGIFCLGMIYRMNPLLMPNSFCIAQTILISFSRFVLAGTALAFSLAANFAVLKPKAWNDRERMLRWRNVYSIPVLVFPLLASSVHIAIILKFDSVQAFDSLHCDSTDPEWVRFVGYAGVPFLASLPSLYLSVASIIRVRRTNRHIRRARESFDGLASVPNPDRTVEPRPHGHSILPSACPSPKESRFPRGIIPSTFEKARRMFRLPFETPIVVINDSLDYPMKELEVDRPSSRVSSQGPTFALPLSSGETVTMESSPDGRSPSDDEPKSDADSKELDWSNIVLQGRSKSSVAEETQWDGGRPLDYSVSRDQFIYPDSPQLRFTQPNPIAKTTGQYTREIPNLAPAVWRIILLQVLFTSIQFLCFISTFVDIVTKRPKPTPLGTQHFALLLSAWGPVVIFGQMRDIRQNLFPWRPLVP